MVNALIKLEDETNRVLNIVKATYNLKDKSQAIKLVVQKYVQEIGEPELRPNFIVNVKKATKEKSIRVNDFYKRYGL